jgi:hypothetical protein
LLFGSRNPITIEVAGVSYYFFNGSIYFFFIKQYHTISEIEPSCHASQILAELKKLMTIEVAGVSYYFFNGSIYFFIKQYHTISEIEPSCHACQILAELKINCVSHYFRNRAFNARAC